jgi:hypothetical protein
LNSQGTYWELIGNVLCPPESKEEGEGCLGGFWEGRKKERLCNASMASLGNCKKLKIEGRNLG